jgi:hypothetical protein
MTDSRLVSGVARRSFGPLAATNVDPDPAFPALLALLARPALPARPALRKPSAKASGLEHARASIVRPRERAISSRKSVPRVRRPSAQLWRGVSSPVLPGARLGSWVGRCSSARVLQVSRRAQGSSARAALVRYLCRGVSTCRPPRVLGQRREQGDGFTGGFSPGLRGAHSSFFSPCFWLR